MSIETQRDYLIQQLQYLEEKLKNFDLGESIGPLYTAGYTAGCRDSAKCLAKILEDYKEA